MWKNITVVYDPTNEKFLTKSMPEKISNKKHWNSNIDEAMIIPINECFEIQFDSLRSYCSEDANLFLEEAYYINFDFVLVPVILDDNDDVILLWDEFIENNDLIMEIDF